MRSLRRFLALLTLVAPVMLPAQVLPSRTISYRTTEGTWMSPDVSTDGRTIVFDLVGDLYTMPITGGTATAIVTGTDFASQPRYSPDGRSIVFVSDRSGSDNLWIADTDGRNPRRVTNEPRVVMMSPAWSADGRTLYATVISGYYPFIADLWQFDVSTGAGKKLVENANGMTSQLVSEPAPGPYGPAASRDGAFVYFASVTPRAYNSRTGTTSRIMRVPTAGGVADGVVTDGINAMRPQLSPDGALLVYGAESEGRTGLRVRRLRDGQERWLVLPVDRNGLESRATRDVLPGVAFTPDGSAVIAAYGGGFHRIELATGRVTDLPFEAQITQTITTPLYSEQNIRQTPVRARQLQGVQQGADGRRVFTALARVYVQDRAGAAPRRLTRVDHAREYEPALSRDGKRVAWVTWDAEGGQLWIANIDGSGARKLSTEAAFYAEPSWSPDGTRLVVLRAPVSSARLQPQPVPTDAELVSVSAVGGPMTRIAPASGVRRPHFAQANDRVYAFSASAGLVSMTLDGSDRRVEAVPSKRGVAQRAMLSPDGNTVAMQIGNTLLRVPMPAVSDAATPRTLDLTSTGTEMLALDGVDAFAWSTDGQALIWSTGAMVHQARKTAADVGSRVDSASIVVETPRATPAGTLVLRDARVITMRGDSVLEHGDVVITANRISAVGPTGTVTVPTGARVVPLSGRTIIPGLIDIHAHWFVPTERVKPDATAPFANLAYGVTTVRDPQSNPEIFTWADMADAGEFPSPRIYSTGPALSADLNFASLEQARATVRRYKERYGTHLLKSYYLGSRQQRQWVVQAAAELGMMPTTEGASDSRVDMTHAIDGYSGNEHSLPDSPLYRDVTQLFAQSGIAFTPTLLVAFGGSFPIFRFLQQENPSTDPKLRRWFPAEELHQRSATRQLWARPEDARFVDQARDAVNILRAGGLVALGGHGEMQGLQNHWEMRLLAEGGMTPLEILRVATINSAKAIGLDHDIGSIEAGKLADLVILSDNPLRDIRNTTSIQYVMRNGFMYDGETLDRVWPDSVPLAEPWWQRANRESRATSARIDVPAVDAAVRTQMTAQRIPAVGVSVVQRGAVVLSKGYGIANLEHGVPATDETMFESGSIGKMFTAAGILALVEDGTVQLDASIRTWFPDAPAAWQAVTVRHLLTHTSGLPDYTTESFNLQKDYTELELVRVAYGLPLEYAPGLRYNYSNTDYVMLGALISMVAGKPYYEFLRERIFVPAGMTTARVISESAIVPHRAAGYLVGDDGLRNQDWVAPTTNTMADGSLLLSVRDMNAWAQTVRDRRVLSAASWRELLSPMRLTSGRFHPYGFGMFVDSLRGSVVYQHSGAWQGFRTQFVYFPSKDLLITTLVNSRGGDPTQLANTIATVIDSGLAPVPFPTTPLRDADPAVTARVRRLLEQGAKNELDPKEFRYFRQSVFPRLQRLLVATLRGTTTPDGLALYKRTPIGDDTEYVYVARYGARRLRVTLQVAPDGGIAFLVARPE